MKGEKRSADKMKQALTNVLVLVKRMNERVEVVERRVTETESEIKVALLSPSGPLLSLVTTMNALDARLNTFVKKHKSDLQALEINKS